MYSWNSTVLIPRYASCCVRHMLVALEDKREGRVVSLVVVYSDVSVPCELLRYLRLCVCVSQMVKFRGSLNLVPISVLSLLLEGCLLLELSDTARLAEPLGGAEEIIEPNGSIKMSVFYRVR